MSSEIALHPHLVKTLIGRLATPVWIFDIDRGQIVWANAGGCIVWRADSIEELCAREFASSMSVTVAKKLRQYQEEFERSDTKFSEVWTHYPKGVPSTIRVTYSGIKLADGRTAMLCEGGAEINETPDKLRSAEALVHTSVMITLHDDQGTILYRNPAAKAMEPVDVTTIDGRFVHPHDLIHLRARLQEHGEAQVVAEVRTSCGVRWHEITARYCMDPVTGSQACLWSEADVTEIKATEAQAKHDACHDPLTKLPNRTIVQTIFEKRLQDFLADSREAALVFIDLDRFKMVNDSLGHGKGDQLLIEIAERLTSVLDCRSTAARLGGDEFVVLLEVTSGRQQITNFVHKLQDLIRLPIILGEHSLRLTSSAGISTAPADGTDIPTLMKNADAAMYEAKRGGRNRSAWFTPELGSSALTRMRMEIDLRQDLEAGVLQLYYQPRVSVRTGRIVSAEVLLRWPHASGAISPAVFIPLAEDSGLIVQIGSWVLHEAARQQVAWKRQGHSTKLSVNVSARQFADDDLLAVAQRICHDTQVAALDIELEITERLLLDDEPSVSRVLGELKRLGFGISIDDFGTGYSNLAGLHKYPIDCLKIDRSFVSDLDKHGPIMSLIISMCRLMGFHIVAEGVETADQLAWLRERDCDEYQGFFYSRPVSAAHFEAMLRADANVKNQEPVQCEMVA